METCKEFWAQTVVGKCPHCGKAVTHVRKEGFSKFFIKKSEKAGKTKKKLEKSPKTKDSLTERSAEDVIEELEEEQEQTEPSSKH